MRIYEIDPNEEDIVQEILLKSFYKLGPKGTSMRAKAEESREKRYTEQSIWKQSILFLKIIFLTKEKMVKMTRTKRIFLIAKKLRMKWTIKKKFLNNIFTVEYLRV
jgi:hypothetical protein